MNHMDIEGRILQSLRPRRDGVLLRSDVRAFGSASQVSAALKALGDKGLIKRIGRGVYVKPDRVTQVGTRALLAQALARVERLRGQSQKQAAQRRLTPTARYVLKLARHEGVAFAPTFADRWASAVTRLAGDDVKSDRTDDLLVALTRAGKLPPSDMVKLVMAHHRELKLV